MVSKVKELQNLVSSKTLALKEAERIIKRIQEENKELKEQVDNEHIENCNQHKKLLAIEGLLKEQDYGNINNLKNRIRTILNESVDGLLSDK